MRRPAWLLVVAALAATQARTETPVFAPLEGSTGSTASTSAHPGGAPAFRARRWTTFRFDAARFADAARTFGAERIDEAVDPGGVLEIPDPDGGLVRFRVVESPVMEPELARKWSQIRTYRGVSEKDSSTSVRFEVTPRGFSAQVLSPTGAWYVEPWGGGVGDLVGVFRRSDALRDPGAERPRCEGPVVIRPAIPSRATKREPHDRPASPNLSVGGTLKTYRLALAATGEYSEAVCAPSPAAVPCASSAMVIAVNRVTGIYETELAVRLVLVSGNDSLIYLSPADPYSNTNGMLMLGENQTNVDTVIGGANYDIGHVFSTGGGGIAGLGVVCWTGNKAKGVTGLSNPIGDVFYVDYVAHEMGHQFGANHSFNGTSQNCGTRNETTAYEPGSGSTIMAYAGICAGEDLQPNSDPYFHGISFDEIVLYTSNTSPDFGGFCPTSGSTGNAPPAVNAGADFTIPSRTPFALTGSATDPNLDPLTFCWEEFDLGAPGPPNDDVSVERPIFRSFLPATSPTRTFPRLADVLSGTPTFGELLPTRSRSMTFRLTARDGRGGGGGVNSDSAVVTVVGTAGPFQVTAPASAVSWTGLSTQTVAWDVAGTSTAPIGCANVAIALSTDGGLTFPTTVLASTPNDGTESITVPNAPTTQARIKLSCLGNVFFNISRPNFTIVSGTPPPTVTAISPGSGTTAGGTAVGITGTDFISGASVTIGGVAASGVFFNSSTSLSAVTGAHVAAAVDVVVTNPGGAFGTKTNGYAYLAQSGATRFFPVTPCRVVDTRNPDGPLAGPILGASPAERVFVIVPGCGVPADAKAVSANLTVTQGTQAGSLRAYPSDSALPVPTVLSFKAGATRANNALLLVSAAGGAGRITVRNDAPSTVHLIVDVNGYFK